MTISDLQDNECHFVTVTEILEEYDGVLSRYMAQQKARNVIITTLVDMSVKGAPVKPHGAALAVSYDYGDAEEFMTLARQFFPKSVPYAFGWVPANLYGSDKFGIFIEQGDLGELLANGMIDDIIQSVGVEEAVTA